jgi:hypothetical protein
VAGTKALEEDGSNWEGILAIDDPVIACAKEAAAAFCEKAEVCEKAAFCEKRREG